MDTFQHIRDRLANLYRTAIGRDPGPGQRQESSLVNGVLRQTLDPDQGLAQQRLTAPERTGPQPSLSRQTFDQLGQRTTPAPSAQQFLDQIDALQQRLAAARQADQAQQRQGWDRGR
jgi:hypothetical protein